MRTSLLLFALFAAAPVLAHPGEEGHHHNQAPGVELLRASIQCELDTVDLYARTALPLLNAAPVPDAAARAAHTKAWEKRQAAIELLAKNETGLAYQRAAEARKQLKKLVNPLWETSAGEASLGKLVELHIACARRRLDQTAPYLQSHPLLGAKNAFTLARERLEGAALAYRQGQVRMAFFKVQDAMHQLDIAIGWQWPSVVDSPDGAG